MKEKHDFLKYELSILSLKAALSTRDKKHPIYNSKSSNRSEVKAILRETLLNLEEKYRSGNVSDKVHYELINETADYISAKLKDHLHKGRFRIGVSQKLVNIHLKYLWVAGFIKTPPHCPVDGIIRDLTNIKYDWTISDSIEEYKTAIDHLKAKTNKNLSEWELENFLRREQKRVN
jgi:hypothetical protein